MLTALSTGGTPFLAEMHITQETKSYRVLVPPAGTMVVIQFVRPDEASKALKAVAYRRLGNSIVYLEKGPLDMFSGEPAQMTSSISKSQPPVVKIPEQESTAIMDEDLSLSSGTTLYVKNLSFVTTQERFTQVFRHLPSFSFARIQTKPDPQNLDGPRLRMGYGFIVFKDKTSRRRSRVYKGSFWMVIPYTSSLQVVLQKKTHHPKIRTV